MNWCKAKGVDIQYIQAVKPMQNGFIERFNRFLREDILDAYWFEDLQQLGLIAEKWRYDYNYNHPHKSLAIKAPCQFARRYPKELNQWDKDNSNDFVKLNSV